MTTLLLLLLKNRSDVIAIGFGDCGDSKRLLTNHKRISVLTLFHLYVIRCIILYICQPFSTPTDAIEMNANTHQPATDNWGNLVKICATVSHKSD